MPQPASHHTPLTRLAAVADAAVRDLGQRARLAAAVVRHRFGDAAPSAAVLADTALADTALAGTALAGTALADAAPDEIVLARVRASLERAVSRPHAVETEVDAGRLVLRGAVLAGEHVPLLAAVRRVRGVRSVEARLALFPDVEGRPARRGTRDLHAAPAPRAPSGRRAAMRTAALVAAAAGAALAVAAARRGRAAPHDD